MPSIDTIKMKNYLQNICINFCLITNNFTPFKPYVIIFIQSVLTLWETVEIIFTFLYSMVVLFEK